LKTIAKVESLVKVYHNRVKALKGVSFDVKEGSIFAILGPNGAGKTTLIKCMLGMIKPSSGSVNVFGKIPFPDGLKDASFVPEEKSLYEWVKVPKLVDIFASFAPHFSLSKFEKLSKRFSLKLSGKVGELSQGNRTKLYVSLAFAQDVKLYVLDEPTWGLDPITRHEVLDVVKESVLDGKTVMYSSHILSEVEEVCDELMILKEGEVLYNGTLDDLKEKKKTNLSNAFLEVVKGDEL
jgi:ABC-2 type transport system ATP-binding protein